MLQSSTGELSNWNKMNVNTYFVLFFYIEENKQLPTIPLLENKIIINFQTNNL